MMKTRVDPFFLLKYLVAGAASFILFACAAEREVVIAPPPQPAPVAKKEPAAPPAPEFMSYLQCAEDTKRVFNTCGIGAFPFLRTVFYDIDGDGAEEMIAGGKEGILRLFKNYGTPASPDWAVVKGYFRGISTGAFSSPAVGDIDNDGKAEVIVGTGGFSSDSGRVLVFRNVGSRADPDWQRVDTAEIRVGNDAAPTLIDMNGSGRPDLVVGNSEGRLFFFKNRSRDGRIAFAKDRGFFGGVRMGMYAVPAAAVSEGGAIIIVGNDMGKLYLFERTRGRNGNGGWTRTLLKVSTAGFAVPAFVGAADGKIKDLVVSDGDGQLYYFRNKRGNYREWELSPDLFQGRLLPGPACTPAMADEGGKKIMTVGNIHGELRMFLQDDATSGLPVEIPGFFNGIKLSGFSKGVLTEWQGQTLLVTGQQDGFVRAFLKEGSSMRPSWTELKDFFAGLPRMMHASPVVFDIDGDGKWELVVGDAGGHVRGFRYEPGLDGTPAWKGIDAIFSGVKVGGYAAPSLFRDGDRISLLVGEQDGRIRVFEADMTLKGPAPFRGDGFLKNIRMNNHSAPSAVSRAGLVDLAVGDYDGNLRHFSCSRVFVELKKEAGALP